MPWHRGGRVDGNYQVDVPLIKWVDVPETPFVALFRMLLRKPQSRQMEKHLVRVTCGLEAKTSQHGVEYFTLWMSKEEADPLLRAGAKVSVLMLPIPRCYCLDVCAEGLRYQTLQEEELIDFQPELVPDNGQSLLFKLADD